MKAHAWHENMQLYTMHAVLCLIDLHEIATGELRRFLETLLEIARDPRNALFDVMESSL